MNIPSQATLRSAEIRPSRRFPLAMLLLCAIVFGKAIVPLADFEYEHLHSALKQDQFAFSAIVQGPAAVQRSSGDVDSKNDAKDPLIYSGFQSLIPPHFPMALRTGTSASEHSPSRAFQPQLPRAPPTA